MPRLKSALGLILFCSTLASAQFSFTPARLPDASAGTRYYQEFHATGGTAPYTWSVRGSLPPGITFDTPSATLTGVPTTPGNYRFIVLLTDSSHRVVSRQYAFRVGEGTTIAIIWTRTPAVAGGNISGEVEVSNPSGETFDLTFIAVAVNEIGRATALGYQHFPLGPGKQRIPFAAALPRGTYVVHADAIGEIARTRNIRRARLQSQPLVIP